MILKILSALAEPTRLKVLHLLNDGGEHCVCALMARLDVSQSRMSRHMKVLQEADLVTARRDAQWVRYRRNSALRPEYAQLIAAALAAEDILERETA